MILLRNICFILTIIGTGLTAYETWESSKLMIGKPLIYLYPERLTEVTISLKYAGNVSFSYPKFNENANGWKKLIVTAYPNGELTTRTNKSKYYYIFWDGETHENNFNTKLGWSVKSEDTVSFLESKLPLLSLNEREVNDFIIYWEPMLEKNKYNLISFDTQKYQEIAQLEIDPKPDTMIRFLMLYKALENPVDIAPQILTPVQRKGFTLVDWGETELVSSSSKCNS